jgi:hypothetical protein
MINHWRYIVYHRESNMIVRHEVAPSTEGGNHVRERQKTSHEKVPGPQSPAKTGNEDGWLALSKR